MLLGHGIKWFALALAIAACSGGTFEGPLSGPGDEAPEGDERSDENPFIIGGPGPQNPGGNGTGGNGTGGGDPGCVTCSGFLAGDFDPNSSELCVSSEAVTLAVFECACDTCASDCDQLCTSLAQSSGCTTCLSQGCSSELAACQAD